MNIPLRVWDDMARRYPSYDDPAMGHDVGKVLAWCESLGIDFDGREVLDIGCGTGTVAIPLAMRGAHVTGIDVSSLMLEKFQDDARRAGVQTQVRICRHDWKSCIECRNYAITIASMTPAVSDDDDIDKMLRSTTEAGIFIGWGAYRVNAMLKSLFEAHGCEYPMMHGSARRFSDRLTQRGIAHNIHFFSTAWEERMSFEDARSYAYGQLERCAIDPDDATVDAVLLDYTVGSMVCFETDAEKGIVAWKR